MAPLVLDAAANSAALGVTALIVATLLGLSLGIFTGARRPSWQGGVARGHRPRVLGGLPVDAAAHHLAPARLHRRPNRMAPAREA